MSSRYLPRLGVMVVLLAVPAWAQSAQSEDAARSGQVIAGETLDPALYGPAMTESMDDVVARDRVIVHASRPRGDRNGAHGNWEVPKPHRLMPTHSGSLYITNHWGDTRMGIAFPSEVDFAGAWVIAHAAPGAATTALRVIGYRAGQEVAATEWLEPIGSEPAWLSADFRGVDRVVFQSLPMVNGAGWFGVDDLTYDVAGTRRVVTFDDLTWGTDLTDSGYAGLTWERGTGDFDAARFMPLPAIPPGALAPELAPGEERPPTEPPPGARAVTAPTFGFDFEAVYLGLDGSGSYPPDTHGAVGTANFVSVVNSNFAVYSKTGVLQAHSTLEAFFPAMNPGGGDPRVIFDPTSQRWIVIATDFDGSPRKIHVAVSRSSSPTFPGFYKTSFTPQGGVDASAWVDYPTLGVDENGIYISAYMVGGGGMTIFALDKAPLVAPSPSLGTVTAFRSLTWEGAIQPAVTYDAGVGEYFVSRTSGLNQFRVRRVNPPLTAPTIAQIGLVSVGTNNFPPNAPALGSSTPIDTGGDARLQMAVMRAGSLWTTNCVSVSGRAACRWYQLNPTVPSLLQIGTVSSPTLHYYYPSLAVNADGHVVLGCSGSNSTQYVGCYYTGRKATDDAGQMAAPAQFESGTAAYNAVFGGYNRWGDYSYVSVDETDGTFWCIQEYANGTDSWSTRVAVLSYPPPQTICRGDANCDGQIDFGDINSFVDAILNATYCDTTGDNADVSANGSVGFEDINPFVGLLTENPLPIICP